LIAHDLVLRTHRRFASRFPPALVASLAEVITPVFVENFNGSI
jgi:hypothetical protein